MTINIKEVNEFNERVLLNLNNLLPQLSSSAKPLNKENLLNIINSNTSHLLIAEINGTLCGSLTVVIVKIPTGTRAWIEDVVVDSNFRGQGVGEALSNYAIAFAMNAQAKTIDLTSRPSRVAANHLYKKIGFKLRETNLYRYQTKS